MTRQCHYRATCPSTPSPHLADGDVACDPTAPRHSLVRSIVPRWSYEPARRSLSDPDGNRMRLSRLHARLIECLLEHGGQASKEQLAEGVWEVLSYHPLRDDKRIQVAVHRLRKLIEHDPGDPQWIVTADDGYRFTEHVQLQQLLAS